MDIVTLSPVDPALLLETTSVDISPPLPFDSALQPPDWGMPLPDMASNTFNPESDWDMPNLDTTLDIGQMPTDWAQPQPEWVLPTTEFSHQPSDWTQPVTPVLEHHAPSAMPRSSSDAEYYTKQSVTAAENVTYYQEQAEKDKQDAAYYADHGEPDKAATSLSHAAAEQAKVTAYEKDKQDALDKAKAALGNE